MRRYKLGFSVYLFGPFFILFVVLLLLFYLFEVVISQFMM